MMEIRDEIEKLETYHHRVLTYEYETINKADVLSILDKWECVAEEEIKGDDWQPIALQTLISMRFNPGDHIIIWRRKKGESGKA